MPINLDRTKERTAAVTVEYAGESAVITYYPHKITKSLIREISESDGDGVDKLSLQLERLVAGWEVVDDSGAPLPVTAEVMAEFPLDFLTAIMRAINEAAIPGETKGANS